MALKAPTWTRHHPDHSLNPLGLPFCRLVVQGDLSLTNQAFGKRSLFNHLVDTVPVGPIKN